MHQLWMISDLAMITLTDPSPTPIRMVHLQITKIWNINKDTVPIGREFTHLIINFSLTINGSFCWSRDVSHWTIWSNSNLTKIKAPFFIPHHCFLDRFNSIFLYGRYKWILFLEILHYKLRSPCHCISVTAISLIIHMLLICSRGHPSNVAGSQGDKQ